MALIISIFSVTMKQAVSEDPNVNSIRNIFDLKYKQVKSSIRDMTMKIFYFMPGKIFQLN